MSTFNGQFDAIPGISADRFDGANRLSSIFFLSHCHTDHMVGLDHSDGLPGPIYLSQISLLIAKRLFPNPKIWDRTVVLEIGQPTLISYTTTNCGQNTPQDRRLTVTAIPAGHCPGSVMFMFEQDDKRILYTGDFRLDTNILSRLKIFQTGPRIDMAYVDSTFFTRRYKYFPHQSESAKEIRQLINEWLQIHPENKIVLQLSARYGYEYLFMNLYKQLGMPVHVNAVEADKYKYIAEMDQCVATDPKLTRIHACYRKESGTRSCKAKRKIPCDATVDAKYIRVIKPSAMVWSGWSNGEPIYRMDGEQFYRVCYSNHASWTEVRDMLNYLRPIDVRLNVLPSEPLDRINMMKELKMVLLEYQEQLGESTQLQKAKELELDLAKFNWTPSRVINVAAEDSDDEVPYQTPLIKRRKQSV